MAKTIKTILIFAGSFAVVFLNFLTTCVASSDTDIKLNVECNNNGTCEPGLGENWQNCSLDCAACNNDGVCQAGAGETRANCAADCSICDLNGICEAGQGENEANCSADCPHIPEPEPGVLAGDLPAQKLKLAEIIDLSVNDIKLTSARINWGTDIAAICRANFGEDSEYKNGTVFEADFGKSHSASITGLAPDTTYHFRVACTNADNKTSETGDQKFSTLALPDFTPPANVSNFQADAADGSVELKWHNPGDKDFNEVRILRSEKFYPADPWAGQIVYEGKGGSFKDNGLDNGKTYYYAAFAYDKSGNYSSGALASAIPGQPGKVIEIPTVPAPPEIAKIDLSQFDFIQNGKKIGLTNGRLAADRFQPLLISIPYDKVPEVLKTIMVTLKQDSKSFSFLLRVNKEKTAYTATLVPPDSGVYPFEITILDYKNRAFKKIGGELSVIKAELAQPIKVSEYLTVKRIPPIIYLLGAVLALAVAKIIYGRVKKKLRDKAMKAV